MLTEVPFNPRAHREKLVEILFEVFNVPAMSVAVQSVLSLCAYGRHTGLVVEIGEGVGQIVPIYQGHALRHAAHRTDIAGRVLTEYMERLLADRGYSLDNPAFARAIKESFAYVALDFEAELRKANDEAFLEKTYELPDGQVVTVGDEQFRCCEALFQPSQVGLESIGVGELTYNSAMKCDEEIRGDLLMNVVLAGGSTMFRGFGERLRLEVMKLGEPQVEVVGFPERKYMSWIGGSIYASVDSFIQKWISEEAYRECGSSVVHWLSF
uniref:Actin n=1 Tax=Arcella intermedia TaxID=1963864 RepID=A0A6B2LDE8_9EUKA